MEATTKTIVGPDTGLGEPNEPGPMIRKQILNYLRRTKLRRADLRTISADLGYSKGMHDAVMRELEDLERDSLIVRIQDNGSSMWRVANAGEERKPPGLFDRMLEQRANQEATTFRCPVPGCGFESTNENGLRIHAGWKHKDKTASEYYAPEKEEEPPASTKRVRGKKACPVCHELFFPRGLGPHLKSHAQEDDEEEEDDEVETTLELKPEVSELLKAFDRFAAGAKKTGWGVAFEIKLNYPRPAEGASS